MNAVLLDAPPSAAAAAAAPTPAPTAPAAAARRTVVQRLQGGIGNQLFQVAYAARVARASGCELAFDDSGYARDGHGRRSVLHRLWPDAQTAVALPPATTRALREADIAWPADGPLPAAFALPPELTHLVLEGYWQDHRVVDEAALDDLRGRLAAAVSPATRARGQRLRATPGATALHVRRHDYRHHGLASDDYAVQALRWLAARHGGGAPAPVFVFSDEPNATLHALSAAGIAGVEPVASGDDLDDLYLMSQCERHVIANSTYSWWAAVLAGGREVVWPAPWSFVHAPSPRLCPPHWKRVDGAVAAPAPVAPAGTAGGIAAALDAEQFRVDRDAFFAQAPLPAGWRVALQPCPGDATATTAFDAHYVYHTAWAARRLHERPAALHTDIGSDLRFVTLASAFQPMRFLDWRPAQITLPGLECGAADLRALALADRSVPSLSCMHVVEHIGLGRYGDPLDFHGADTAMRELQRVLAPGGWLYFAVPVGAPTIVFHAHRIFRAADIVRAFGELELAAFALVHDDGRFSEQATLADADAQRYGCGCFLFRRPAD